MTPLVIGLINKTRYRYKTDFFVLSSKELIFTQMNLIAVVPGWTIP